MVAVVVAMPAVTMIVMMTAVMMWVTNYHYHLCPLCVIVILWDYSVGFDYLVCWWKLAWTACSACRYYLGCDTPNCHLASITCYRKRRRHPFHAALFNQSFFCSTVQPRRVAMFSLSHLWPLYQILLVGSFVKAGGNAGEESVLVPSLTL